MQPIHRPEDDELCGFIDERADGWHALTIFGGQLDICETADEAEDVVRRDGLASLMERWILVDGESGQDAADDRPAEQIVCIQEANPHSVTLALDYYSMPGVATLRVARADLDAGRWILRTR